MLCKPEDGAVRYPEAGTPQVGVIYRLLANLFLREVLDERFEREVRPRLHGRALPCQFADDFVLVFEREDDARRVLDVLPNRLCKYGLRLLPDKTRLGRFKRPPLWSGNGRGDMRSRHRPETLDFLGFAHHWDVSLKKRWYVRRETAKTRLTRAITRIREWCREHRHDPVAEQRQALGMKLRGHYGYYGITGNGAGVARFFHEVTHAWHKWLARRSQKAHLTWARFQALLARYLLPLPRVVHSVFHR